MNGGSTAVTVFPLFPSSIFFSGHVSFFSGLVSFSSIFFFHSRSHFLCDFYAFALFPIFSAFSFLHKSFSLLCVIDLMALPDSSSRRNSLIPSFIYSSSPKTLPLQHMLNSVAASSPSASLDGGSRGLVIPSTSEPRKIEMYSPIFYAAYTAGGTLNYGLTHMAVTPFDLVKCNMQIDPTKYKSISSGFGVFLKEQGFRGFFRGWVPTLLGCSAQGACKFGFYEFFKKYYSDIAGPEYASKYKTLIYLAGSASAKVIIDVALCPFEAVKVRVQTQPCMHFLFELSMMHTRCLLFCVTKEFCYVYYCYSLCCSSLVLKMDSAFQMVFYHVAGFYLVLGSHSRGAFISVVAWSVDFSMVVVFYPSRNTVV